MSAIFSAAVARQTCCVVHGWDLRNDGGESYVADAGEQRRAVERFFFQRAGVARSPARMGVQLV
jgi:hypothetical protein